MNNTSHYSFELTQTAASKKKFPIKQALQHEMARAAALVAETELPELHWIELSVIAMSDEELLELNRSTLGHDYLTDIITFEIERTTDTLEAEIYISVERATENAKKYRQKIETELLHLIIHGTLHLAGYSDKSVTERKQMRKMERLYLTKLCP